MGRPPDSNLRRAIIRAFLAEPVESQFKRLAAAVACSEHHARKVLRAQGVQPVLATPLERAALAKMRRDTLAAHFTSAPPTHG